jgi:1-acyl-sn-glycerol-3-phosphate acyltransferase
MSFLALFIRRFVTALGIPLVTILGSVLAILLWPFSRRGDIAFFIGRTWSRILLWLGGVRVEVRSRGELPKGAYVFVANHSSNLDIWLMFAHLNYDFRFVSKKEWGYVPLFGWAMRAADIVFVDRGNSRQAMTSIIRAADKIRSGRSILIFPEGTRSRDGELMSFKGGALYLALRAQVPVVPIAIEGAFALMPPSRSFITPGKIVIHIGTPIETASRRTADRNALADEARDQIRSMLDGRSAGSTVPCPASPAPSPSAQ